MATLSRDLLKELECPVCLNYLTPPITLCSNGHSLCSSCRVEVDQCPTCRANFLLDRNVVLEKVIGGLKYPCINQDRGCSELSKLESMNEHEAICCLGKHACPMNKFSPYICAWEGYFIDFESHVRTEHGRDYFAILHEPAFASYSLCTTTPVIFTFGETFLYHKRSCNGKWFFVVFLLGGSDQAAKFKSVFTFRSSNGVESIVRTLLVRSIAEDLEDIFESYKCLRLDDRDLRNFVVDNKLDLEVEISFIDE